MRISRHAVLHCGRAGTAGLAITGVPEGHGSWASGVERSDPELLELGMLLGSNLKVA